MPNRTLLGNPEEAAGVAEPPPEGTDPGGWKAAGLLVPNANFGPNKVDCCDPAVLVRDGVSDKTKGVDTVAGFKLEVRGVSAPSLD